MAQNLKINILAQDKTKQAFNGIRGRLAGLKDAVLSVKGALVSVGAALVIKQFVDVGRTVEDLQVRLKQLFGSTQEGAKAFDVMANFASRVPFSLDEIQAASGNLAVVAGDADRLSKILEITGNVAAVTGLDFRTAGEQIQRSFAGGISAADIFREKGVRDMLGFKAGATVTAEETIKAFERVFGKGGKFGEATKELSTTFTGTLSMLGDKLFNFKKNVANAQFFDELKKAFGDLDAFLERNARDIEAIAKAIGKTLAFAVKAFATAVRGIGQAVGFVRRQVENLLRALGVDIPLTVEIAKSSEAAKELTAGLVKAKTVLEETLEIIKKQNQSFSISKELVASINKGVKGVSKAFAETLVLGKKLNTSLKELAQSILIEVIAKTTERLLLLKVEQVLEQISIMQQEKKLKILREQGKELRKNTGLGLVNTALSFLPTFASGGAIRKGQPAIVGERGAEMFIPNSSGQITQASRGTSNGAVSVNFNINTIDSRGFDQALVENRGTITSIINNALAEKGRGELI
tara:strand:+ start:2365 stop:3930 length:1566 start_codon:yes stop_codon:yes gene_type:complete